MASTNAVFTVEEAAAYLKIPKPTVYQLAQAGKIPCQKVGRHWRFSREAIDRWLETSVTRTQQDPDVKV